MVSVLVRRLCRGGFRAVGPLRSRLHVCCPITPGGDRPRKRANRLPLQSKKERVEPAIRLLHRDRWDGTLMSTGRREREQRQHLGRPSPPFAALQGHGMMTCAGGLTGASVESAIVSPWPMGYAGGMRIGNFPRTGDQPS